MSADIRRLYLFHLFNSIAVAVVGNYLFLDKLFLRLDLNMSQFGVIKGISWWFPMMANVPLAVWLSRRQIDRQVVAIAYLIRMVLPFALLGLPMVTRNTTVLTIGFATILVMSQFFPVVANNCLAVLMKAHIPHEQLGRHTSGITALWFMPFALVMIPAGWYVELHSHGSDHEFIRAMLIAFCCTTIFQIPASIFAWRMSKPAQSVVIMPKTQFTDFFEPLRNLRYRAMLSMVMAVGVVSSMIGSFMYPYLIDSLGWQLQQIGFLVAGVSLLGGVVMPMWGKLTDRIGGRNMVRLGVLGIAVGVFCLSNRSTPAVICFAVLAWQCETGVFGSALIVGRQYLMMSMSSEKKSHLYLAWIGPALGTGMLIGSIAGGLLLDWLAVRVHPDLPGEHYRIYFTYCAMGFLLCGGLIAAVRDGHRSVTAAAGMQQAYRWIRTVIWRGRL